MNGKMAKACRRHAWLMAVLDGEHTVTTSKGERPWTVKDSKRLVRSLSARERGEWRRFVWMVNS